MKNINIVLLIVAIVILGGFSYFISFGNNQPKKEISLAGLTQPSTALEPLLNDEGGVSIEAAPVDFSLSNPVKMEISFTTHQGDLNFDLTKISYLLDDKNNKYFPEKWDGGTGGHHLSGILYFSEPIGNSKTMEFVIENVYNIERREFLWKIK